MNAPTIFGHRMKRSTWSFIREGVTLYWSRQGPFRFEVVQSVLDSGSRWYGRARLHRRSTPFAITHDTYPSTSQAASALEHRFMLWLSNNEDL